MWQITKEIKTPSIQPSMTSNIKFAGKSVGTSFFRKATCYISLLSIPRVEEWDVIHAFLEYLRESAAAWVINTSKEFWKVKTLWLGTNFKGKNFYYSFCWLLTKGSSIQKRLQKIQLLPLILTLTVTQAWRKKHNVLTRKKNSDS